MRLETLSREQASGPPSRWVGSVLCGDVLGSDGRPALLKGHRLERADALAIEEATELHVVWLEAGDVDEDSAAMRLAAAAAGAGVERHRPVESQVRLSAGVRGVLRVDTAALAAINAVEGCTVFTLLDGMPVDQGRTLAGAKVTPLAIGEEALRRAEDVAAAAPGGVLRVDAFLPMSVAVVVRERLGDRARERFEASLRGKLAWLGAVAPEIAYCGSDPAALRTGLSRGAEAADLVLCAGVASTDPLEAAWRTAADLGARMLRRGLPVHPGSSYWVAELRGRPLIGVASCGMFSRRTALDLLLARLAAGGELDLDFLAGLGHGGLLASEMGWRFPPLAAGTGADEPA